MIEFRHAGEDVLLVDVDTPTKRQIRKNQAGFIFIKFFPNVIICYSFMTSHHMNTLLIRLYDNKLKKKLIYHWRLVRRMYYVVQHSFRLSARNIS